MRDVNPETITGSLSWYKILPLNGFNVVRVKPKLLRKQKRADKSSLEPTKKLKVIYTDNSVECSSAIKAVRRLDVQSGLREGKVISLSTAWCERGRPSSFVLKRYLREAGGPSGRDEAALAVARAPMPKCPRLDGKVVTPGAPRTDG